MFDSTVICNFNNTPFRRLATVDAVGGFAKDHLGRVWEISNMPNFLCDIGAYNNLYYIVVDGIVTKITNFDDACEVFSRITYYDYSDYAAVVTQGSVIEITDELFLEDVLPEVKVKYPHPIPLWEETDYDAIKRETRIGLSLSLTTIISKELLTDNYYSINLLHHPYRPSIRMGGDRGDRAYVLAQANKLHTDAPSFFANAEDETDG